MTRTKRTIAGSAVAFFSCALVGVACSSTTSESPGSGGSGAAGGSGAGAPGTAGSAGHPGAAGSAGSVAGGGAGGAGGAAGTAGAGGVNNCTPLPMNLLLTDFSPATLPGANDGTTWSTSKTTLWGNASSLTGGDGFYQGKPGSAPKVTLHGQTLTVSATIEAGDYAGYIFNFTPKCTNASSTQGLRFDVISDSTLGNATLKVQMQQRSNYPSTANPTGRPGDCVPTSMATQYDDCLSPATTVVSSGSTLTPGTVELPWSNFGGGSPKYELESNQLMAIQWQFECPPGGGTVSASNVAGSGGDGVGGSASAGESSGGVSSGGAAGSSAGTSGDPGSGGAAGFSGTAGSGGTAGTDPGAGGTAGTDPGSAGTAGSSAAGTAGTAGSSAAGSGGTGSSTPPCVVQFTFDNVTFY